MVMQNAIESTMPGRIPEVNRSPIDTLAMTPKMMKRMLGGISIPSTELPATTPTENAGGMAVADHFRHRDLGEDRRGGDRGAGTGGEYGVGADRSHRETAAQAFQHQRSHVERVAAHCRGRDEQPHEDEQGNDAVGIGGNGGCGGPGKQLARDFHALHREYAGERQEHQRHSDMHSGLNQNDAAQHGQRANHDVTHSGSLPCPNACANSWPANKTY